MNEPEVIKNFARLERQIAREKGDFNLFALFMREDAPDRWDLVVAAPWVGDDKEASVRYFVAEIKSKLGGADLTNLSRIVLVDPADVRVRNLNRAVGVEHGAVEVKDSSFFGLPVKHAYIITSKKPVAGGKS
jgi:hypothetical protein